jgi:hypothetical protein
MKSVHVTTVGDLADFLEKEIAAGRNPTTPAQWAELMQRMAEQKKADYVGDTDMTPGYIAGSLRDEGINARVMKSKGGSDGK